MNRGLGGQSQVSDRLSWAFCAALQVLDARVPQTHRWRMSFADQITRSPLAYAPDVADEAATRFDGLPAPLRDLLAATAGCSPYLAGLLSREADWISGLETTSPEALRDSALDAIAGLEFEDLKPGLRCAKRRLALLAAVADLGGVWSLAQVTGCLTALADHALERALAVLVVREIARGKMPEPAGTGPAAGMCVLAMGKLGAGELNYSSDIDLICLFDETRFSPDDYVAARAGFVRITRALTSAIADVTADGYVFRTDLRLRPDASVTPVCIAMEAAERYYESVGRTWERAAFIKARPCAGDIAAGEAFLGRLRPFIWRRHLDFAAIQDAHDMRLRIRSHKGLGGAFALEGHNIKLGAGGIREIEFFTQTRQLIAGGRTPELRVRGTLEGLEQLTQAGWIDADSAEQLSQAYRAHREIEHRLQMIGDAQTQTMPTKPEDFDRLARFCGIADTSRFRETLTQRLQQTAQVTDAFFEPAVADIVPRSDIKECLDRWQRFPALRSPRAVEIFTRVFPTMLEGFEAAPDPDGALAIFEEFLKGLPAGVQVFSLFDANPDLSRLVVDICTTSPALAAYLGRHSAVLDAVIGGSFFRPWPGVAALSEMLHGILVACRDYEEQLDAARRWQKEWHFRIGVHHLKGLIQPELAGQHYADLAEAVLCVLVPVAQAEFARKHGTAPGRGMVVLAMGSLGAGCLNARSDLDLISIYDAGGVEASDGPRPLAARSYFAKLTQALITALSAPTAAGRLYEVDLRLRPSGQSGPVATSLEAYGAYQRNEAWVWEHLALTRARSIVGEAALQRDTEAIRDAVLSDHCDMAHIAFETGQMRSRLAAASAASGPWDVRPGPGGGQDIDLFAQAAALCAGETARDVGTQLRAASRIGWLDEDAVVELCAASRFYLAVVQASRLISETALRGDQLAKGGLEMLLRDTGLADDAALDAALTDHRQTAKAHIDLGLRLACKDSIANAKRT